MNIALLGQRIKSARIERNMSIELLANAIGVNKSTVSRYERGEIEQPKIPVIDAIANTLSVNPSWLIGKSEDKTFTPSSMDLSTFEPCSMFPTLKKIRENFGYSTNEVAFKIGISEKDYIAIENGRDTSCLILSRLAVLFCCSTDCILAFDGVLGDGIPRNSNELKLVLKSELYGLQALSPDESELIRAYRDLDNLGKTTALTLTKGLLATHPGEDAEAAPKEA